MKPQIKAKRQFMKYFTDVMLRSCKSLELLAQLEYGLWFIDNHPCVDQYDLLALAKRYYKPTDYNSDNNKLDNLVHMVIAILEHVAPRNKMSRYKMPHLE